MRKSIITGALLALAALLPLAGCENKLEPKRSGGLGETCLARNDCGGGLSCINQTCVDSEVPLDVAAKQCDLVECTKKADCCAAGEDCRCEDEVCVDVITCTTDSECFFIGGRCLSSGECGQCEEDLDCGSDAFCVDSACVECKSDSHCDGNEMCIGNFCSVGCTRDEQCGALEACDAGECVPKDCESDRECVAYLKNPRATCGDDGDCTISCDTDAECNVDGFDFQVCDDGACAFVGCESHAECRAYFGETGEIALCRGEDAGSSE